MKKILFITNPLEEFNILSDSTYFLMVNASELGLELYQTIPNEIYTINNQVYANTYQLKIKHTLGMLHHTKAWYQIETTTHEHDLANFDFIFIRNNPPFDLEYYYLTNALSLLTKPQIINSPESIRNFNEKLAILNFPALISETLVTKKKSIITKFCETHQECVIKPIDLMAGSGVFKLNIKDPNFNPIIEGLTNNFQTSVMVQKFIPEVIYGDKRIFIINGEIINYCLYRIPQAGEIRGNLAVGGRGEVHPLNQQDHEIAEQVRPWLIKNNILIAGLDVIGTYLTEINITSPTAMQQIYNVSGINIAKKLFNSLLGD